jgi:hypothetical protein
VVWALGGTSEFEIRHFGFEDSYRPIADIVRSGGVHPEGILDNWSAIVFDPTHDVMLARGFDKDGKFSAPERVTKLFDGDLVGCQRLLGQLFSLFLHVRSAHSARSR